MFLYLYPFYPLLDYSGYDCAVSICCQQNATVDLYVIVRYFRWKISLEQAQWKLIRTSLVFIISFPIYNYVIVFVQSDTFVTEHHSFVAEINFNVYVDSFLIAQDRFQIFLFQRTIICKQLFLPLGCLKQVLNRCYEQFIGPRKFLR